MTKNPDWKNKHLTWTEREVPADFSKGRVWQDIRYYSPKWWERIAILFGWNLLIHVKVISEHSPGRVAAGVTPQITKYSARDLKENPSLQPLEGDKPAESKVVDGVEMQKAQ